MSTSFRGRQKTGAGRRMVFSLVDNSYGSSWLVFAIAVLIEVLIIIPVMIRLFPKFTAQNELIKSHSH